MHPRSAFVALNTPPSPVCQRFTQLVELIRPRFAVRSLLAALFASVFFPELAVAQTEKSGLEPGLVLTFSGTGGSDQVSRPNVWLYVPNGQSPTSFLNAGPFTATWDGYVLLDLRSEYSFHAEFNGRFKLEINGTALFDTNSTGAAIVSRPVRLNKGTNSIRATLSSPATGDAFVRLQWASRGALPNLIPTAAFAHAPDDLLRKANQIRLGRDLLIEHRCLKCHTGAFPDAPPDLALDAPSLEGIGSRRRREWMADWILDAKKQRPSARMPQLFRGSSARQDAEAAAAFLASLKDESLEKKSVSVTEAKEAGERLFENLHCAACHVAPGATDIGDSQRLSLGHVRTKFLPGALEAFLRKPDEHYRWIRMPNFHLTVEEAAQLRAYLETSAPEPASTTAAQPNSELERGKQLVQTSGCLNCHSLKLENRFSAIPLANLPLAKWQQGCMAERAPENSKAPHFSFTTTEREALRVFAATDRSSLARAAPVEFAERQMRNLNCRECHGKFDGFPPVDLLGGKLKPEWAKAFIAGAVKYKPRPWLEARMPAFEPYATGLAEGMAMMHGHSPRTKTEDSTNDEATKIGQKLVSAAGGFSCVACHAIGESGATLVFESPGINLAHSGERLLKSYFQRWVRNPLAIDPTSKMPVYFDEEGRSPLTDVYDGDGAKQIEALWQYVRLGDKMPPPPTP